MHFFRRAFVISLAAFLVGCGSIPSKSEPIVGPVAWISDSGFAEEGTKLQMFSVVAVDGIKIESSESATVSANHNRGFSVKPVILTRQIQARPMKISLSATHVTGAPIHALASMAAGTFFRVSGTVDFTPQEGEYYVVKGELKKDGSSVWIQERRTGRIVTEIVLSNKN